MAYRSTKSGFAAEAQAKVSFNIIISIILSSPLQTGKPLCLDSGHRDDKIHGSGYTATIPGVIVTDIVL